MRASIPTTALAAALVLSLSALAEDRPQRVVLRGDSLATIDLRIATDGIDDADPASVARAAAEVDAELDARVELQYGLVMTCELGRGYSGLVNSEVLQKEADGEDLADLRRRIDRLARARVSVAIGKSQAAGANRLLLPTIVKLSEGSAELLKSVGRVLLQGPVEGRWRVVRSEEPCPACEGLGRAADGDCTTCAGHGWIERPIHLLPADLHPPEADLEIQRNEPCRAALSFLRERVLLSRKVLAGFASAIGPVHRDYCRRILTPAALADLKTVTPAGSEIKYEAGDALNEENSTVVAVLERARPRDSIESRALLYVHLSGDPDRGFRVQSFGPVCRACGGNAQCAACFGTGKLILKKCRICEGTGVCVACEGRRITPCELLSPRY